MSGPADGFGYTDAVRVLQGALRFGINPSLDGIEALCDGMGRPHESYRCIQVGGTNGKSSVVRMLSAILREHGVRVGCYTSPHLLEYRERVEVDGKPVSEAEFARGIRAALDASEAVRRNVPDFAEPTEFELVTAAALWLFRDLGVDVAVLEVGMGGRWDATSVVSPAVAVVTGVALDHTAHLGKTREAIAAEKARIISSGSIAVLGPGTVGVEREFVARAEEVGAEVVTVLPVSDPAHNGQVGFAIGGRPDSPTGLTEIFVSGVTSEEISVSVRMPAYQAPNVAVSLAAAATILDPIDAEAAVRALSHIEMRGRFQVLDTDPWLIVDGAHNPSAARVLAEAIQDAFGPQSPVIVLGVLSDKDATGIVAALAPVAGEFAIVAPHSDRAMRAEELYDLVGSTTDSVCTVFGSMPEALAEVCDRQGKDAVVTGSLTTVADAVRTWTL